MNMSRRLPGLLLAVVAVALTAVIFGRVSAGADPAPQDTTPIVLEPSPPASTSPEPQPTPSTSPTNAPDDGDAQVTPRLRDDDDDDGPDDDDDDRKGHDDEHDDD